MNRLSVRILSHTTLFLDGSETTAFDCFKCGTKTLMRYRRHHINETSHGVCLNPWQLAPPPAASRHRRRRSMKIAQPALTNGEAHKQFCLNTAQHDVRKTSKQMKREKSGSELLDGNLWRASVFKKSLHTTWQQPLRLQRCSVAPEMQSVKS